jgi:16S rRNA (uracil1498-N3)-methyltransferase
VFLEQRSAQNGDHLRRLFYMARRLFFVDGVRRDHAELNDEDAHHLVRVLRVEPGQIYELSDNRSLYLAEVEAARKDRVVFRIVERRAAPVPRVRATLLAALIKFDRFEWIVEKATELGAERIVPVAAARTDKGLEAGAEKRLERWRRIALESCQQARRPRLPILEAPVRFADAILQAAGRRYFLDEMPGAPPLASLLPAGEETAALLLGPEGGWTEQERAAALASGWLAASLGPNILRAETAAAAALAILMNLETGQLSMPICVSR